jgi:hypothetical protein
MSNKINIRWLIAVEVLFNALPLKAFIIADEISPSSYVVSSLVFVRNYFPLFEPSFERTSRNLISIANIVMLSN